MEASFDFHEKQYLGFNRFGILRRIVLVVFCFLFYFASEDEGDTADLFFYLGMFILVISAGAMMVSHLETQVTRGKLTLVGPMTHRRVEMDLSGIRDIEVAPYSRFMMNIKLAQGFYLVVMYLGNRHISKKAMGMKIHFRLQTM